MGFLEGDGAIWSSTPSPWTLGSHLPVRHSNRVQQGAEGCRLSAPELAPPAGSGCHASHPPRLPGADSAPWNKQSPTMTADTRHSPPGLPSDQWGLAQGLGWDLGSCPGRFWFLPIWVEDHTSYAYAHPTPLSRPCSGHSDVYPTNPLYPQENRLSMSDLLRSPN